MENLKQITEKRINGLKARFFNFLKNPYNKAFFFLLILALAIRLWIFSNTLNQPIWWDGTDYLSAAKNWGLDLKITDIWYFRRGFLFPLVYSFFFRFGLGETSIRFTILLFSLGTVAVSYFLIRKMFNEEYALLASLGLTFSWVLLFFTGRILTDIPAAFLLLTSLLFFWKGYMFKEGKKNIYLFVIFFALAVLTRMQTLMFAPAFLILIFTREKFGFFKKKTFWLASLLFLLFLTPQIILYAMHYGNPITDILAHYFGINSVSNTTPASTSMSTIFRYIFDLPYIMDGSWNPNPIMTIFKPFVILLILGVFYFFTDIILGFDKIFKNEEIQKKLFVFVWIVIPFLVLGYITLYVEQRYASAALPFLFMIAGIAGYSIFSYFFKILGAKDKLAKCLVFLLLFILLTANFMWGIQLIDSKKTSYLEIKEAGIWLNQNSNPSDLIITASRPQVTYYAERSVQSSDPHIWDNKTTFEKTVKELKPSYLVLSVFEQTPDWLYAYPQEHQSSLIPVKAFYQGQQPIVIIYKFNYTAFH